MGDSKPRAKGLLEGGNFVVKGESTGFSNFDDVVSGFKDEDTDTWIAAAIALGESAHLREPDAQDFMASMLAHPTNPHYRRHAMCALASYMSARDAGGEKQLEPSPCLLHVGGKRGTQQVDDLWAWVRSWFLALVLAEMQESGIRISDMRPEIYPFGPKLLLEAKNEIQSRIDDMERKGIQPAIEPLRKELQQLENEGTALRDIKRLQASTPIEDAGGWIFSSFLAGASPGLLESLSIPIEPLFLAALGQTRRGNLGYLANCPRFLARYPNPIHEPAWIQAMMESNWTGSAAWGNKAEFLHQILHLVRQFARTPSRGGEPISALVLHPQTPPPLRICITKYFESLSEPEARLAEIESQQLAAVRQCIPHLHERLRWREASTGERTSIVWLLFLLAEFSHPDQKKRVLDIEHRISLTLELIEKAKGDNQELLVPLVRLLKLLFYVQLTEVTKSGHGTGNPKYREAVFAVCQQQIDTITPILDGWGLKETIYKDMATIAARALDAVFAAASDNVEGTLPDYFKLLYTVLFALPEPGFQRELKSYAKAAPIKNDLEIISSMACGPRLPRDLADQFLGEQPCYVPPEVFQNEFPAQGPNTTPVIRFLTGPVSDDNSCRELLKDLVSIRQRLLISKGLGNIPSLTPTVTAEIEEMVELRASGIVEEMVTIVTDINDALDAIKRGHLEPSALEKTLRTVNEETLRLRVLCRENLPMIERIVVGDMLAQRLSMIKRHMVQLSEITEMENEALAIQMIGPGVSAYRNIVSKWMYDRYMLAELAGTSRILQFFLSPVSLAAFAILIFGSSLLANRSTGSHQISNSLWTAAPFLAGLVMIPIFGLTIHHALKRQKHQGFLRLSSFLMPQVVATLFLGVMQNLGADDGWASAFLKSPDSRLLGIIFWLSASYYFVKKVMIGDQNPTGIPEPSRVLHRRARGIITLGLWQSFFLLLLFSMLMGPSMAGKGRTDLVEMANLLPPLAQAAGTYLPNVIDTYLGTFHLMVFPWALLSWTFSVFFFGAVFEQIMKKQ